MGRADIWTTSTNSMRNSSAIRRPRLNSSIHSNGSFWRCAGMRLRMPAMIRAAPV
ncbi:curF domain protein [Burkholderia pseudomallei MSHR5596]|nr:curF domain protein [Burkholderia pseudomallei MSHR5596]